LAATTVLELPIDRSLIAEARFDALTRAAIRPLLTKRLIAEHKRNPLGDHSDALKRVLNYFRRTTTLAAYVVVCTTPFREWRLALLSGERGKPPTFIEAPTYNSEAKAMHALFLKRVEEVMRY
jgi:branched-chain amino acid transport system permease protein